MHLFLEVCLGCMVIVEISGMLPNRSSDSKDRWPEEEAATSGIFKKNLFGAQACPTIMMDTYLQH